MGSKWPRVVAVGLTGGIGAGKSTALAMFRDLGAVVLSADRVVHALYAEPEVTKQLVGRFGEDILAEDGTIDRRRLAQKVQGNLEALRWLEHLTHPRVRRAISRVIAEAPSGSVVVCEVPLLFEAGFADLFDLIVTVEAGPHTRRARSVHGFASELFAQFEGLQASAERRARASDLVYFNDGSIEDLSDFVRQAYRHAQAMLDQASGDEGGEVPKNGGCS